jgi:WD40 repeat protein
MTAQPLNAQQSPSAIDALCRHWMAMALLGTGPGDAADALGSLLLQAAHAPSDPAERALFWMLSGQSERYQELDHDGTLLAQALSDASPGLRQRLAAVAADAGRVEWLRAMQHSKPLDQFTADDWTSSVRLLQRAGDPVALWQWLLQAPPVYGPELLQALLAISPLPPQLVQVEPLLQRLAGQLPEMTASWLKLPYHCAHTIKEDAAFMSWSQDGRCLASGSSDGTIRLWDPGSGTCTVNLNGPRVHVLAWSPDGNWLASGDEDKTIRLWNASSGTCAHVLTGHPTRVCSLAWSPDGRYLASTGYDKKIEWWNPDHDSTIRLWDISSGACARILAGHTRDIQSIAWSPDGRCLASSSSEDGTIRLWDPFTGTCIRTIDKCADFIAWSPDGRWLAFQGLGTLYMWDPSNGSCTIVDNIVSVLFGRGSIDWSPDSSCVVVHDTMIRIRHLSKGNLTYALMGHNGMPGPIAWSPNGRCLASACSHSLLSNRVLDPTIRLWDPSSGSCTHILKGHTNWVRSLAWSPDGRCLASASSDGTIRLWVIGLSDLLNTPLACYSAELWSLLAASQQQPVKPEGWQPWLDLISTLGAQIRRYDISLDDATQPVSSLFEIAIDD